MEILTLQLYVSLHFYIASLILKLFNIEGVVFLGHLSHRYMTDCYGTESFVQCPEH